MQLDDYSSILGRYHWHLSVNHVSRGDSRDWLFVLLHLHGPCTRDELISTGMGLMHQVTVYRNLALFLGLGVAQEVRPGVYELTDRFKQHHHYMWCRACGRRVGLWDERLEKMLERATSKMNFAMEEHHVEVSGICPKCLLDPANVPRRAIGTMLRRPPGWN
jgi:Fe2+ or Zn2+ uptake regulation protein